MGFNIFKRGKKQLEQKPSEPIAVPKAEPVKIIEEKKIEDVKKMPSEEEQYKSLLKKEMDGDEVDDDEIARLEESLESKGVDIGKLWDSIGYEPEEEEGEEDAEGADESEEEGGDDDDPDEEDAIEEPLQGAKPVSESTAVLSTPTPPKADFSHAYGREFTKAESQKLARIRSQVIIDPRNPGDKTKFVLKRRLVETDNEKGIMSYDKLPTQMDIEGDVMDQYGGGFYTLVLPNSYDMLMGQTIAYFYVDQPVMWFDKVTANSIESALIQKLKAGDRPQPQIVQQQQAPESQAPMDPQLANMMGMVQMMSQMQTLLMPKQDQMLLRQFDAMQKELQESRKQNSDQQMQFMTMMLNQKKEATPSIFEQVNGVAKLMESLDNLRGEKKEPENEWLTFFKSDAGKELINEGLAMVERIASQGKPQYGQMQKRPMMVTQKQTKGGKELVTEEIIKKWGNKDFSKVYKEARKEMKPETYQAYTYLILAQSVRAWEQQLIDEGANITPVSPDVLRFIGGKAVKKLWKDHDPDFILDAITKGLTFCQNLPNIAKGIKTIESGVASPDDAIKYLQTVDAKAQNGASSIEELRGYTYDSMIKMGEGMEKVPELAEAYQYMRTPKAKAICEEILLKVKALPKQAVNVDFGDDGMDEEDFAEDSS